mgnify:CR=1 FL=1
MGGMPPEAPRARCRHALPGRLRLTLVDKRGDAAWFDRAAVALATMPGVTRVDGRPRTGSLLIEYDIAIDELLRRAAAEGLFHVEPGSGPEQATYRARLDAGMETPAIAQWAAMALLAAAAVQVARREILPPAVSLLVYAATALLAAERRQARSAEASVKSSQARSAAAPPT